MMPVTFFPSACRFVSSSSFLSSPFFFSSFCNSRPCHPLAMSFFLSFNTSAPAPHPLSLVLLILSLRLSLFLSLAPSYFFFSSRASFSLRARGKTSQLLLLLVLFLSSSQISASPLYSLRSFFYISFQLFFLSSLWLQAILLCFARVFHCVISACTFTSVSACVCVLDSWLREHQRQGVQFMFDCLMGLKEFHGEGCILADDMGLGKTLQSITILWTLLEQGILNDGKPGKQQTERTSYT